MNSSRFRRGTLPVVALTLALSAVFLGPVSASPATPAPQAYAAKVPAPTGELDLGAPDLSEKRTVTTLAPGLTLTSIVRGAPNPDHSWTAEVTILSTTPDAPASPLSNLERATAVADKLSDAGIPARVEHVQSPQLADAGGDVGYRVRAGEFPARADGTATVEQIKSAGFSSSVIFTGWDGEENAETSDGQWNLQVLTIDPRTFHGELTSSFGADLERRETTSQLSAAAAALAAVNGGFFVFDPNAGAPGDPAGAAVQDGEILSEPVGDRPALVLGPSKTSVQRPTWDGTVTAPGAGGLPLDGLNRVPGLIRNCGGTDDQPTSLPLHDVTCTDPDEVIAFTPAFGATTPSGSGVEVALDAHGKVIAVNGSRGMTVPAGGHTVQATGTAAQNLELLVEVGSHLKVDADLTRADGKKMGISANTDVVNGGPMLVENGTINVTAKRDGMVRSNDSNSFFYGWVHKRNPRTIAGVDALGRTLLVTADGRQTGSLGLSIKESAEVAASLGMVDAINLDGGGSTTMVADGQVRNISSDTTGERPVGDALLVLPGRGND